MKLNTKVRLKKSYAKWHLEHLDVYFVGGDFNKRCDPSYEGETQLHLVCCLGEPVYGKVLRVNTFLNLSSTYLVKFKIGKYKTEYWVEEKHVDIV